MTNVRLLAIIPYQLLMFGIVYITEICALNIIIVYRKFEEIR